MRREGANIQSDSTAGSKDVTAAFTQTRTPGGSTVQGAESDIYDRLVEQGTHRPQTRPPVLPPNPTARSSPVRQSPATGIPTRRL